MELDNIEDIQENQRLLIEDFVATCDRVFLGRGEDRWECQANQRGGAIWLIPAVPLPVEGGESLDLYCPHPTGTYRFTVDILEAATDRLIATRTVNDPMGWRVSMRGEVRVPVTVTPHAPAPRTPVPGTTHNLSRLGMLAEIQADIGVGQVCTCDLHLDEDVAVRVVASVVRKVAPADGDDAPLFGMQFQDVPLETQRTLFEFILTQARLPDLSGT